MDDDFQPFDLGKITRALRRRWALVMLFAIATCVIGLFALRFVKRQSFAIVAFRDPDSVTLASQLQGVGISVPRRSPEELAATLNSGSKYQKFAEANPGAERLVSTTPLGLKITVSSSSFKASERLVNQTVSEIRRTRTDLAVKATQSALKFSESQDARERKRLADVDKELAETDASSASAAALSTERLAVRNRIDRYKQNKELLRELSVDLDAGTAVLFSGTKQLIKKKILIPGLLVFGSLLGIVLIAFAALRDRTIRSRRDVEKICGPNSVFALLDESDLKTTQFCMALRNSLGPSGDSVLLSSLSGAQTRFVDKLAHLVSVSLGGQILVRTEPFGAEAIQVGCSGVPVILLAWYGETGQPELQEALFVFESAGAKLLGVAIAGIDSRR